MLHSDWLFKFLGSLLVQSVVFTALLVVFSNGLLSNLQLMYAPNVWGILFSFSNLCSICSTWLSLLYTGNRLVRRFSVFALGSMNIFTVPMEMYSGTCDKCTYCKSLWIKASAKRHKC